MKPSDPDQRDTVSSSTSNSTRAEIVSFERCPSCESRKVTVHAGPHPFVVLDKGVRHTLLLHYPVMECSICELSWEDYRGANAKDGAAKSFRENRPDPPFSLLQRLCEKLCARVSKHLPQRVIEIDGQPNLLRFYIAGHAPLWLWPGKPKAVLGWLPFGLYLHRFLAPDGYRDLHNHPWTTTGSLILTGGYDEEYLAEGRIQSRPRYAGSLILLRQDRKNLEVFHRVARLHPGATWSLFFTSAKATSWGFWDLTTQRVVPHRLYRKHHR